MTKKKTKKIDEGFLDALIGDYGAAGMRSMFKKGMTREAQLAQDLFIKDFVADATSSLSAGIQGGFVDPNIRGGTTAVAGDTDSMAVKTANSRTATQPAGTPGAAPKPGAALPTSISGSFTQKGAPAQAQQNVKVPPQNVKFNMNTPGARPTPKVAPKSYPAPANTRDVKAANRVPDDISETAHYKKLNAIFESIFEATGGQSIAAYLTTWFNKYMGGVNWQNYKDRIEPIIQNVENTYSKDKGVKALRQLGQAAFSIVKVSGVEPDGAKNIQAPAGTQGNTGQQGGQQDAPQAQKNLPTIEEIQNALTNMQLADLEALRDSVESAIASKKKPADDQQQYMGKIAPNARPASKPANPLTAPTINPNRGTVAATGKAPAGDITKGGIGITRESKRYKK